MHVLSAAETQSSPDSTLETTVHRSIEDVNENQLNSLVAHADGGTLFHRHEWLSAVEESVEQEPRHIMTMKSGNPVGFLPNFVQDLPLPSEMGARVAGTLPFEMVEPPLPGYGGPIITGDREENLNHLFDLDHLTAGSRTLFHRVQTFDLGAVRYGRYFEALGYSPRLTKCDFFLDLRDEWETIRDNMDASRRREMRRAIEQDHDVEIAHLGDDLERTYEMYVSNMERVGGEILPRALFEALDDRLPEQVRVFRATVDGEEVGRYVYLLDDESGVLHHWLSAIGDADNFEYYPSELLHRQAIQWGSEQGYDQYCFGPTNPHFSDSVFKFKEKYGATPHPSLCWERGTLPLVWRVYDRGRLWYRRSQIDTE